MIGRIYGIKPWEMKLLTLTEMEAIERDLKTLSDAS